MKKFFTSQAGPQPVWTAIVSYSRMLLQRNTPWKVKAILAFAVLYLLSPFDLVPDWLLGLGLIDDLAVVSLLVSWAIRLVNRP